MRYTFQPVLCALALSLSLGQSADAAIQSSVGGGALAGQNYITFQSLPSGAAGGNIGGVTVSFQPAGQAVSLPDQNGVYAAPFLSGNNGVHFDNAFVDGADQTQYVTTGTTGSEVSLSFGAVYSYLGLLWGSADSYNTLSLFKDGALVAAFTGDDVASPANGGQGLGGTYYVNITGIDFDEVVATSTNFAFEFDNVAYGNGAVPEAATIAVWTGLSLLGGIAYRRRSKTA